MIKKRKPGRPRIPKSQRKTPDDYGERLNVRIDPDTIKRLKQLAEKHENTFTAEVANALLSWLDAE
jgi:hypothetical protein